MTWTKICAALGCTVADLLESSGWPMPHPSAARLPVVAGRISGPGPAQAAAWRRAALATAELTVGKPRPRAGQCQGCLGWGMLAQPPCCSPCHLWRSKKYHHKGACRRCGRAWPVNTDGLCEPRPVSWC